MGVDERDLQRLQESFKDTQRDMVSRLTELASELRTTTRDLPDKYIPRRDLDERFRDLREEQRRVAKDFEATAERMVDEAIRPMLKDISAAHEAIRDLRESGQFIRRAALTALISGLVMMGYTIVTQLILKH